MSDEQTAAAEEQVVTSEKRGAVQVVTLNRPQYRNAQNSAMTYALDDAFAAAAADDEVKVIVLAATGDHFSAGHDIGSPGRDVDAFFADPVVRMGIPGVEYFAHPWVMGPRFAKEFLFLGEKVGAERALQLGMVNRVVPRADLEAETVDVAERIAKMPRMGLALTKMAVNQCEDLMGLQSGMDSVFGLHHAAHSHNAESSEDHLAGHDARSMRDSQR